MTLTGRLTRFFLIGLAIVLIGFSITIDLLAREHLHRQLDDRLDAAINTLIAGAEIEENGIEWEIHERRLQIGGGIAGEMIEWTVHDGDGNWIDGPGSHGAKDRLAGSIKSGDPMSGFLQENTSDPDRRVLRRFLSTESHLPRKSAKPFYDTLVFTVSSSSLPVGKMLDRLSLALTFTSIGIWIMAFLASRWFCRRALRPVMIMAEQACVMNVEDRHERLRVSPSGDELEALGRSFNGLLDRLHEALERQRRFTGDASHQLRTPLAALLGQVEVALRHPRSEEEYRQTLTSVAHQGRRLGQIVDMLLYLARANAEADLENLTELDLRDWLTEHLQSWSDHPRARDLLVESTSQERCGVLAQSALLGQLVDNLIDNAFKYSESGSPVRLSLDTEKDRVLLIVEDHGIGLAEADLPHLFEPFFRSESARARGGSGIGLGLSIVQRIAKRFGGAITARGTPGQGSQFTLSLPLISVAPEASKVNGQ